MGTDFQSRKRWVVSAAIAACLLGAQAAQADKPEKQPFLALQPGVVSGKVNSYTVKHGDSVESLAAAFKVNPVRITRPNGHTLDDGLHTGDTLYVDQREIIPTFDAKTEGIVLNVPQAEVYLVQHGRIVRQYPVGVSMSDWKAPLGSTKVVDMEVNPTWHVPHSIQHEMARKGLEVKEKVAPGPKNPLGTRWIGFADGTYGFHGTTEPGSLKRYASHGCVRFARADIEDLYRRVHKGTPVHVYYQPVLLATDANGVWAQVYPDIYDKHYDFEAALRRLAEKDHATDRLDPAQIKEAIKRQDGMLLQIGRPLKAAQGAFPGRATRYGRPT